MASEDNHTEVKEEVPDVSVSSSSSSSSLSCSFFFVCHCDCLMLMMPSRFSFLPKDINAKSVKL